MVIRLCASPAIDRQPTQGVPDLTPEVSWD